MNEKQKATLVHAINHFGVEGQINKALEEMGELTTELSRRRLPRYDQEKVAEEIADAMIMLEQLRIIFGASKVDGYIAEKLERLEKTINGDWRRQERMMPKGMIVHRSEGKFIPGNDVRERTGKYSTVTCVEQFIYGGSESEAKKAAEIGKLWTEGFEAGRNSVVGRGAGK